MIKNYQDFAKQLQKFHLDKPKLSIHFEANLPDSLNKKWRKMDEAILKVIWQVNRLAMLLKA